jgi:hypothetical protein
MQHVIDRSEFRDRHVSFYVSEATLAALWARAAHDQRSLSNTVARIVRDAVVTGEAAKVGGSGPTRMAVRNGRV